MTSVLRFARDLAYLEGCLEEESRGDRECYGHCPAPAIAESYLHLLTRLAEEPAVSTETARIVAEAIDVWRKRCEAEAQQAEAGRQRQAADRAESMRRHELALTAECPYCGSAAGLVCRTTGPKRQPKGVEDHRDRWRAALGLLDPDQRREWREYLERQAAQRRIDPDGRKLVRYGIRYLDKLAADEGDDG